MKKDTTFHTLWMQSITLIRAPCALLQHVEKPEAREACHAILQLLRYLLTTTIWGQGLANSQLYQGSLVCEI